MQACGFQKMMMYQLDNESAQQQAFETLAPLIQAIENNDIAQIKSMVEAGSSLMTDYFYQTQTLLSPLATAIEKSTIETDALLINLGAKPNDEALRDVDYSYCLAITMAESIQGATIESTIEQRLTNKAKIQGELH